MLATVFCQMQKIKADKVVGQIIIKQGNMLRLLLQTVNNVTSVPAVGGVSSFVMLHHIVCIYFRDTVDNDTAFVNYTFTFYEQIYVSNHAGLATYIKEFIGMGGNDEKHLYGAMILYSCIKSDINITSYK